MKALGHVAARRAPTVAIALGGGGARGIAHVLALEALDEMEIKPAAIAGASMGAVVGAAYAAGIEARDIRAHVLRVLRNRSDVMAKLLRARVGRFADIVLRGRGNPVLLDAELFLDLFWPADMPVSFEALEEFPQSSSRRITPSETRSCSRMGVWDRQSRVRWQSPGFFVPSRTEGVFSSTVGR